MTEKELEKLFRNKLKNREVAFNPASWEKMKPMLADIQPAPAWWQTRRAAAIAGVIGLSSIAYFWGGSQETEGEVAMPAVTVVPSTGSSDQGTGSDVASPSEISSTTDASLQTGTPTEAPGESQITYEDALKNESPRAGFSTGTETVADETTGADVSSTDAEVTAVAATTTASTPASRDLTETQTLSGYSAPSEEAPSQTTRFAENTKVNTNNNSTGTPALLAGTETNNSVELNEVTTVQSNEVSNAPTREVSQITSTSAGVAAVEEKENIAAAAPADEDIIINRSNSQKSLTDLHEFILLAGTNASFPYASSLTESNSPAFSYMAGLEYRYYFSPTYSIRSGLTFAEHANVNCLRIASEKVYDFGSTIVTEHVKTKNFQFLEIPLTLGINLAPNFSINAGGYTAFMVNMDNEITTVTETALDVSHSVTNQSGYTNAYSNWDAGFKAGVTYRITNRFMLGAEGTFGLIDQTKNEYFLQDSFDRNIQARFYIGYKLF